MTTEVDPCVAREIDELRAQVRAQSALARLAQLALAGASLDEVRRAARELTEGAAIHDVGSSAELRESVAGVVAASDRRHQADEALRMSEERLAKAQRLAHVGSYDWEIGPDINSWSDELYRIYGTEPQSFNASYDKFLEFIHPDDRPKTMAIHQHAYATGEPYHMEERIVRPNGDVRVLSSTGEVILDSAGRAVRMRGICMDITDQRRAEAAVTRSLERFEALIESSPDAVLVVAADGTILQVNGQVSRVFGYEPEELVGRPVEMLVPEVLRGAHEGHRAKFLANPGRRGMGTELQLRARRKDGSELPIDVGLGSIDTQDGLAITAFVRDVTERSRAEEFALRLHDADVRRRHALEINDNVVQGMSAAMYAFESGFTDRAMRALDRTLDAARLMMNDLLGWDADTLVAGSLLRDKPAATVVDDAIEIHPDDATPPIPRGLIPVRVLVADDSDDIRMLLRLALEGAGGFEVLGEAADGAEAVELNRRLRPDVIVLDLAMPVMDGLEAIPVIRGDSPDVKIVVLSGFDQRRMRPAALAAGADAYLEKGGTTAELVQVLSDLMQVPAPQAASSQAASSQAASSHAHAVPPAASAGDAASAAPSAHGVPSDRFPFDALMLAHELRTPATVVQGLACTLRDRLDDVPPATVRELLRAIERNALHIAALVTDLAEARDVDAGVVPINRQPADLPSLVRDTVIDLSPVSVDHSVVIDAPEPIESSVDPTRIRQVVANLLTNAVRYSPAKTAIEFGVHAAGPRVRIVCRDRGPGVPEARRCELFHPFARLDAQGSGMGLGLFISRGIARSHGGDLTYESRPEGGGQFVLELPHT